MLQPKLPQTDVTHPYLEDSRKSKLIFSEKTVYTKPVDLPRNLTKTHAGTGARISQRNRDATSIHHTRDTAGVSGHCMAVAVETAFRTTAGRHYHRAEQFQALFPPDYRPAGVPVPVAATMVVVPEIIITSEEDK